MGLETLGDDKHDELTLADSDGPRRDDHAWVGQLADPASKCLRPEPTPNERIRA